MKTRLIANHVTNTFVAGSTWKHKINVTYSGETGNKPEFLNKKELTLQAILSDTITQGIPI